MTTPVLSTKLFVPPQRPQVIARARLIDALHSGRRAGRRLSLVCAPAGFGKTTVLSQWVADVRRQHERDRIAWLSLDDGDNDPVRFLAHLLAALEHPRAAASAPVPLVLTELINRLGDEQRSTLLILDDFQSIDAAPVRDAIGYLVEHQPSNLHIVIASRSDPLLPLARLRGSGDLTELRAADLRCTPGEAAAFLNDMCGLALSTDDIAALETRTEGWIAGLQLAALSMRAHSDVSGFIDAFTGSNRFVIDYLGEEVLQRQPEHVRSFLLQTAFLGRLSAPLCDAVTGRSDSAELLEGLEHANLFVVPLDDERRWYRYHALFADVLRARSLRDDPLRAPRLHRLASAWHEQHGLPEEAIDHALAAGDHARAASLIERALPEMRQRRQDSTLLAWLTQLPEPTIRRLPVLGTFTAWALLVAGDLEGADRRLDDAERSQHAPGGHDSIDGEALETLPVTIATYRAAIAQGRGDAAGTERHARTALHLAAPSDHLGRGAGGGMLGLALWAKGDLTAAVSTFATATASLELAGHTADAVSSATVMADMLVAQGRRRAAWAALERGALLAASHGDRSTVDLRVSMSELCREEDDLDAALEHLRTGDGRSPPATVPENAHRWFVAMAGVEQARGEQEAALLLLDEAERRYMRGYFPDVRPIPAMRARIWIRQGRLDEAAAWLDRQGIAVDDDELRYRSEFAHITLVRLLIARFRSEADAGVIADAMSLLKRLLDAAEAGGREGSVSELLVLQALALDAQDKPSEAQAPLRRALAHAEAEGCVRLFTDEGAPIARLLGAAARERQLPRQLRSVRWTPAGPVADAVAHAAPPATDAGGLSPRELTVLRLLTTELSGPQIARELFVSLNTLRTHTKHIFDKLAVNSRAAAVRTAREQGLV